MRKKILTVVAAGVLGLSGVAAAGPALAAVGATDAAATVTSRVDRLQQALSGLVTDGTLTQAQADKVATTLDSSDALRGPGGHGGPGGRGGGRDLATAATALGVTQDELRTALQDGKTLAQVAADKGVDVDTLVNALVEAEKTRIAEQVTAGRLTQAQADERLADLTERVTDRVNSTRPDRPGKGGPAATPSPEAPNS
ncbi:MAG TPA: hypothetical protein VFR07_18900 [Mycobacteriales bacterium]|nr:hypothetical protein [Mycobacteriales bacterium]